MENPDSGVHGDIEVSPGVSIGQWFHDELAAEVLFEKEAWAIDRVNRVVARLNSHRPGGRRLQVVIPWISAVTALTAPGPFIFFYRGLYQLCPDDEVTAFVIAHEMAHHDLGHMSLVPEWMGRMGKKWGGRMATIVAAAAAKRLYGPERECDADLYALRLCIKAGYDPERCIRLFQILENHHLDYGDISAVVGTDAESDQELEPSASRLTKLRVWAYQRRRGYLPIRDRLFTLRRRAALPTR
jgi:predicted Zn-dependent protease